MNVKYRNICLRMAFFESPLLDDTGVTLETGYGSCHKLKHFLFLFHSCGNDPTSNNCWWLTHLASTQIKFCFFPFLRTTMSFAKWISWGSKEALPSFHIWRLERITKQEKHVLYIHTFTSFQRLCRRHKTGSILCTRKSWRRSRSDAVQWKH